MELDCPSCDARFRIDPTQLGTRGRKVRCGSCGYVWHQAPRSESPPPERLFSEDEDFASARSMAASITSSRGFEEETAQPRSLVIVAGWLAFSIVLVGLLGGAWFLREEIVEQVPETAELYDLLGIGPEEPGFGLELHDVTSVRRNIDGRRVLVIEGAVVNVTDRAISVPPLRATITDASGQELQRWDFQAALPQLEAGGATTFETSTENAPGEGDLTIVFLAEP